MPIQRYPVDRSGMLIGGCDCCSEGRRTQDWTPARLRMLALRSTMSRQLKGSRSLKKESCAHGKCAFEAPQVVLCFQ